jgi:hypothetical protein
MSAVSDPNGVPARTWWARRRLRYNLALLAAGVLAFACFVLLFWWTDTILSSGYHTASSVSVVLRGWSPLAAGALVAFLLVANVGYFAGPLAERVIPAEFIAIYRRLAFRLGLWLSVLVPFVAPAMLAGLLFLSLLMGYGKPVRVSDLPGTYRADYGPATSAFTLTPDGRFTQTVRVRMPAQRATAAGTWTYDARRREITFSDDFMIVETGWDGTEEIARDFAHPAQKSQVDEPARWLLGRLEIGGDDVPWGRVGGEIPWTKQRDQ